MDQDGLLALCAYSAYANKLVLDTVAQLTEEEFTCESSPSHGSVRSLLHHMLRVEAGYLATCQESLLPSKPPDLSTVAHIRRYWSKLEQERQDFVASLNEGEMVREISVQMGDQWLRFPIWQMLVQAFIHSIHHRGELSIVLTGLGYPLPTLDIIIHFTEQSGQTWPWK
jgi:uncharacterized damage-inducible protein DinB